MNSKDLQSLIKVYVRQALTEALAEKYLQNIVKEAVQESLKGMQVIAESKRAPQVEEDDAPIGHFRDQVDRVVEEVVPPRAPQRKNLDERKIMNRLGVKDPLMSSIFEDTLRRNNPIVTGEQPTNPEVPENVLEQMGVIKNWDRYIK